MKVQIAIFILLIFGTLKAQRHEIGAFLGGSNGITDIGRTNYINPFPQRMQNANVAIPIVVSAIYRYNLDPQFGLRANIAFSKLYGNDLNAVEDFRLERGREYRNNLTEASVVLEYNFFDFNTIQKSAQTPFIFAGVGVFGSRILKYNISYPQPLVIDPNNVEVDFTENRVYEFNLNIPFGLGYKVKYNWNWVFWAEVGFRYTNTDNLDFSTPSVNDFTIDTSGLEGVTDPAYLRAVDLTTTRLISSRQTGDVADKDWYVFTGIGLTYTFGRPPCKCN